MKSKQQKQAEAIERKRASIPGAIQRVQESVRRAKAEPNAPLLLEHAVEAEARLARLYREVGFSQVEAEGAARSVTAGGKPGSWLSGMRSGAEYAVEAAREPEAVSDAVARTRELVPGVTAVCIIPHPFRRAIQIRADGPESDGSLVANIEILELDRLEKAFMKEGILVFRREEAYLQYQLGTAPGEQDAA